MAQLVLQHRWQDHPLVAMGDHAIFNSLDGDVGEIADVEPGEGEKLDRKIGALVVETARGLQQVEIFRTADTWLNLVWIRLEMLGALKIAQLEMAEQAVHSRQAQIDGAGLVASWSSASRQRATVPRSMRPSGSMN